MTRGARIPGRAHRRARLRDRARDARRLRSPLPPVPAGERRGEGALRGGRLARPAAGPGAAHRLLRAARRRGDRAAAERVRGGDAADGGLAAGQAPLHRPAHQPLPARARRDLLQLGDDQDPAPQLLPQRLHLRPLRRLDRPPRERRAGGAADLPRLLPDQGHDGRDLAPRRHQLPARSRVRGPRPRRRRPDGRRRRAARRASACARTSRSRCCRRCSSATRAPTSSARSSTASPRRRSRCRSCTAGGAWSSTRRCSARTTSSSSSASRAPTSW